MKLTGLFPLFCLLLCSTGLRAQGYCSGDAVIFTEPAHPVDYADVIYKTAPQIDEWNFEVPENIRLRVYYPTDLPAGETRPLIVLVHGGFFIWGSYLDFDAFAKALAQKGFVAATVGYRLCKRGDCVLAATFNLPCQINWGFSFLPSAYVAAVDVTDGVRWLQQNADDYHIDPEKVVMAGHSAGAFTALNVTFLDQAEIQEIMPAAGVSGKYLGEPLDPVSGIRACIPMAGATLNTDWIDADEVIGENIAVAAIHGTSDGIVGYGEKAAIPCCQTFSAQVAGGCEVVRRVAELGGNHYLLSGEGFGHDIGESPWFDTLANQIPAFVVKTVICGENIAQHSIVKRATALQVCPGNNPNIAPAPLCDVVAAGPPIPTPVTEAPPGQAFPLRVYPTRTHGPIQLEALSADATGEWQVDVLGADGHFVRSERVSLTNTATLDLGALPQGIYFLQLRSLRDGRQQTLRVVRAGD